MDYQVSICLVTGGTPVPLEAESAGQYLVGTPKDQSTLNPRCRPFQSLSL
jgi:hypothetical protein